MPKLDPTTSISSNTPSKTVIRTPEAAKSLSQSKVWNTKNIGLRLASDFTAGFLAAGLVAPVITVIDKSVPSLPRPGVNTD
jgi:hypothetical protein